MKNVFKIAALFFMALLFMNCEQELQLEEETIANATAGVNVNIKRNRLKQRANGLFKNTISVNDPLGNVAAMEVQMLPSNDIFATPNLYFPDLINENDSIKKFKFNQLNFENGEAVSWPFKQVIKVTDIEGQTLGDPLESWVTAQDNDEVTLVNLTLRQNGPTADFRIKAKFQAADSSLVDNVTIYFKEVPEDRIFEKNNSEDRGWFSSNRTGSRRQDDIYSFRWDITYDEADGFETELINPITNEVGLVVEVKNEAGAIVDNDLYIVTLENTAPEGIAIKKTKHVIKANGNHKLTVKLEGTQSLEAEKLIVVIPGGNADGSDLEVEMDNVSINNPTFTSAIPEGVNVVAGQTYVAPITVFDAAGEPIAFLEGEFTVTTNQLPEDPVIAIYEGLAQNPNGNFTYRASYQWDIDGDGIYDDADEPQQVFVSIEPTDGGSETETAFFELFLVAKENTRTIYEGEVPFIENANVLNRNYNLVMTRMVYLDEERAGHRGSTITGQEEPFSIVRTCMTNGSESNLFNYSIATNEVSFQNTDIIYVSFTTAENESLTTAPVISMFRSGAENGFVNFQIESIRFLDLNNVAANTTINFSLDPNFDEAKSIAFETSENIHRLGYFDEDTGEWLCEDQCLEVNGSEYCGETDHL